MALTAKLQYIGKELIMDSYEFYKAEKGYSDKIQMNIGII